LPEPPDDRLLIPHFRTVHNPGVQRPSPNLLETVQVQQRRQAWLRENLVGEGESELTGRLGHLQKQGPVVEAAILEAVSEALAGRHAAGATLVRAVLESAPAGSSGWMLPVEPFLQVSAHPAEWAPVLAILRSCTA
jgi:hypothetical protein